MIAIDKIKGKYGNETGLIILCCRVFFKTATINELQNFIDFNEIKWNEFFGLVIKHKIRPIVFKTIYPLNLPAEVKLRVHTLYTNLSNHNFKLALETERIIILLQKNQIEAVPYKGIAYSKQFFNNLYLRESTDIDLVVGHEQLESAIKILETDNYESELGDIYSYLGSKYHNFFKDYNFNKYHNDKREFHVELHWAVVEKEIGIDKKTEKYLFDNGPAIEYVRYKLTSLNASSHFAAVFLHHAFKDNFNNLKAISDLSAAFTHEDLKRDAITIKNSFSRLGISLALSVSNGISEDLFGVSYFYDPKPNIELNNYFIEEICGRKTANYSEQSRISRWVKKTALLQENSVKRFKFYLLCFAFRFIPGRFDFRAVQLPKSLFFLYYISKPFRTLVTQYSRYEVKKLKKAGIERKTN